MQMQTIGVIHHDKNGFRLELEEAFRPGLEGLKGFGWVQVIWWAHRAEAWADNGLTCPSPYRLGPPALGVFATRSPRRPNPLGLSAAQILSVDSDQGHIHLAWIDCEDGTPVLDVKPYHPSADRVEAPLVPDWCRAWPDSVEASGEFDWSTVFGG